MDHFLLWITSYIIPIISHFLQSQTIQARSATVGLCSTCIIDHIQWKIDSFNSPTYCGLGFYACSSSGSVVSKCGCCQENLFIGMNTIQDTDTDMYTVAIHIYIMQISFLVVFTRLPPQRREGKSTARPQGHQTDPHRHHEPILHFDTQNHHNPTRKTSCLPSHHSTGSFSFALLVPSSSLLFCLPSPSALLLSSFVPLPFFLCVWSLFVGLLFLSDSSSLLCPSDFAPSTSRALLSSSRSLFNQGKKERINVSLW